MSFSNISKTVQPRITKFYSDIHTDMFYSRTRYDIIIYFRSEAIGEKNSRKYRLRRLRVEFLETIQDGIMKLYMLIEDNRPHKFAGNDVTSCFLSAFIEVLKTAESAATDIALFALSRPTMQCCIKHCQRRLQIFRVKNIDHV